MSDSIRVMIYDKTALEDGFDLTEQNDNLTMTWLLGAKLFKGLRSLDYTYGASSWADALDWLNTIAPGKTIKEIQFWGHGWSGRSYIGSEWMDRSVAWPDHKNHTKYIALQGRLNKDSLIWFRNCSVFCGEPGHRFAKQFSEFMGCQIAAHTHIIGLWQGGLHTIRPGEEPSWSVDEGIEEGPASWPKKCKWSRFWTPNTIFALRASVPRGW